MKKPKLFTILSPALVKICYDKPEAGLHKSSFQNGYLNTGITPPPLSTLEFCLIICLIGSKLSRLFRGCILVESELSFVKEKAYSSTEGFLMQWITGKRN